MKGLCRIAGLLLLGWNIAYAEGQVNKNVVGWIEKVQLHRNGFQMHAKVDTGADFSSMNVPVYEVFDRNGAQWVRFTLKNNEGETLDVERPIVRIARIKTKCQGYQPRYVVEMGVCLGGVYKITEVNIVDRSQFKYQFLVGRSFLNDDFLVDSATKYGKPPSCR